jgi:hypothetical protein
MIWPSKKIFLTAECAVANFGETPSDDSESEEEETATGEFLSYTKSSAI